MEIGVLIRIGAIIPSINLGGVGRLIYGGAYWNDGAKITTHKSLIPSRS